MSSPSPRWPGLRQRASAAHRSYPWWPLAAGLSALLLVGTAVAAADRPAQTARTPRLAAARPPAAASQPAAPTPASYRTSPAPVPAASVTVVSSAAAPVRAMVAEYPMGFTPGSGAVAPAPAGAWAVNAKSAPLVLPPAGPAVAAPFPSAPPGLSPVPAAGALPTGAMPTVTGGPSTSNAAVEALIHQYFPAAQWDNASRVSLCESGQRNVVSAPNSDGTRDYGVFQLNTGTLPGLLGAFGYPPSDLSQALVVDWNVRAAARLWQQRGWEPWTCAAKLGIVAGLWSSQPGPGAR